MRETVLVGNPTPPPNAIGHGYITPSLSVVFNYVRLLTPIGIGRITFVDEIYVSLGGVAGDVLLTTDGFNPIDSAGFSSLLDIRRTLSSTSSAIRVGNVSTLADRDISTRRTIPKEGLLIPYRVAIFNAVSAFVYTMQPSPLFVTFQWFEA